jgi:hypothetical protein
MENPFVEADALNQAAIAAHYGEEVMVEPRMLGGDYSGKVPDPSRPARRVRGVVSAQEGALRINGSVIGHGSFEATKIATEPTTFWLPAEAYAGLGYDVGDGDAIRCIKRAGSPLYTIVRRYPSDMGDVSFLLAGENQ